MILVELKGRHVEDAYNQLMETHNFFKNKFFKEEFCYSFRIVVSKNKSSDLQEMIKQKRKKGLDIKVGTNVYREKI